MGVHKGGRGVRPMWTGGGGQNRDFFVDVTNGWPLSPLVCNLIMRLEFSISFATFKCFLKLHVVDLSEVNPHLHPTLML